MVRYLLRSSIFAAAALAAASFVPSDALAQAPCPPGGTGASGRNAFHAPRNSICQDRVYGQPDLFYNFYVPGRCGGYPAAMYPAPLPTPPIVGHVYYTYQPFLPHEMMYRHRRNYYNVYDGGRGLNHTTVTWW